MKNAWGVIRMDIPGKDKPVKISFHLLTVLCGMNQSTGSIKGISVLSRSTELNNGGSYPH